MNLDVQIACLHRPLEDIARFIIKADAVIVSSTFMYMDQMEHFTTTFASDLFGKDKRYRFYMHPNFLSRLNGWNSKEIMSCMLDDEDIFINNLKTLVVRHEVYDICMDDDSNEFIKDDFAFMVGYRLGRQPYKSIRIIYDEKNDVFIYDV